ncbi:MAG: hypothetical protein ABFS35_07340 [Bacteroidota bacterium]
MNTKNVLKIIVGLSILIVMSAAELNAQILTKDKETMKYQITIINKYFGRTNNRVIITEDSLAYERKVYKGNNGKIARLLTREEKKSLENFLKDFPLNELEESYYTNAVKDGTQMTFVISINDNIKEIFIGNVYQEDLGKLVALVVPMLPEDFIQYKKELIYPY